MVPTPATSTLLVTGAGTGLGAAIARAAASAGFHLALHAHRHVEAAAKLAAELEETCGLSAQVFPGDLADPLASFALAEEVCRWRPPTHFVANAAVFPKTQIDNLASWRHADTTFSINCLSAMRTFAALRSHAPLRSAVFITDARAAGAWPDHSVYLATKAALESFVRSAAVACAPALRVNAVAPGPIEGTPLSERLLARLPQGRAVSQAAVVAATLWLLSDEADSVTGHVLRVDGGRSLA